MVIIVGIVGGLSALDLFIASIFLFIGKSVLLGLVCLFIMCYVISVTVLLIRSDAASTKHENEINRLKEDVKFLKDKHGIAVSEEDAEEEAWNEEEGKWEQKEDGTWQWQDTADESSDE